MVIIQNFLKSMEMLFSVEYVIPCWLLVGCLFGSFLFYELYLCINALVTLYCIYTPPAHFDVFPLYCLPPSRCEYE